ncbi:MAG: hypothetical protein ACFFD8_00305 [Candidatus Thorarchaeota archaeon]
MMGLTAKSSTKEYFLNDLGLTLPFELLLLQLAYAFTKLAKTRLTEKQQFLLFAAHQTLHYHTKCSFTALAEHLSRKLQMPLSTTKFNLNILRNAGLLKCKPAGRRRTTTSLSYGGQLLIQLLSKPNME